MLRDVFRIDCNGKPRPGKFADSCDGVRRFLLVLLETFWTDESGTVALPTLPLGTLRWFEREGDRFLLLLWAASFAHEDFGAVVLVLRDIETVFFGPQTGVDSEEVDDKERAAFVDSVVFRTGLKIRGLDLIAHIFVLSTRLLDAFAPELETTFV